ncbi:MAG TPA: polyprenyl synthetase family protein [Pseudoclavibacter sp.]|nr:polyprenyl synthetase family protein [Pseudoclavibacter sp.]
MDPTDALLAHFDKAIDTDLAERADSMQRISEDTTALIDAARVLLTQGKRMRPRFCYWGWRAIADRAAPDVLPQAGTSAAQLRAVLTLALGLEYFHAAALIHDDIIDRSDSRRGNPAVHRFFEARYQRHAAPGEAEHFGVSAAILLGDLLLTWSHELFATALAENLAEDVRALARRRIHTMATNVTIGQFLDVWAESAWESRSTQEAVQESLTVLRYKSAKYSVEDPLLIGATLAGASVGDIEILGRYGLALGEAFQLRDDILGVFGDPVETGKPAGDDIREGKRTALILFTRDALPHGMRTVLDESLGNPRLDSDQIEIVRRLVRESGALEKVERMISERVDHARTALVEGQFSDEAGAELNRLIDAAAYRSR